MVVTKNHCKTQHFQFFWLPDLSPELEKPEKTLGCSMVAIKNHCKTHQFQYFWLPDLSPELEKPKQTLGFLMVAIQKHSKTQCFCYFWSPRSLSRSSPKPLQNLSKIDILKS